MGIEQMFNAPIPGESLTREPGSAPWEQPPRMVDIKHVAAHYFDKFEDDEALEGLLDVLDKGAPIERIVSSMTLYSEMQGEHDMEASVLVSPMLHEYFKFLAESAGINYVEFVDEEEKQISETERAIEDFNLAFDSDEYEEPLEEIEETPEEEPTPSKGLISRRQ